ncbi:MAG: hypothetical protein WBB98_01065 [Xanthobacteraceae bacterium]
MAEFKISRGKLHELVWSASARKVADQLDTPYERLLKACKAANIPRPSTGYWTRLLHGKAPRQRPELKGDPEAFIWLEIDERKLKYQDIETAAQQFSSFNAARVSANLEQPHSAIKRIAARHRNPEDDLTIRILRILDCVAKALENEGFKVSATPSAGLDIKWREGCAYLKVGEDLALPRDEHGRAIRSGEPIRTGKLYSNGGGRLVESGKKKIEDMIPRILHGIGAACLASDRKVRESRERTAQVAARRAEMLAERERSKLKHDALAKFIGASEEWHRIQRAYSFLDQVEQLLPTAKTFLGENSADWISHLRIKLNEQDPLKEGLENLLTKITSK